MRGQPGQAGAEPLPASHRTNHLTVPRPPRVHSLLSGLPLLQLSLCLREPPKTLPGSFQQIQALASVSQGSLLLLEEDLVKSSIRLESEMAGVPVSRAGGDAKER